MLAEGHAPCGASVSSGSGDLEDGDMMEIVTGRRREEPEAGSQEQENGKRRPLAFSVLWITM